ncbi:hypothetical protein LUZ62_068696 [Rhynchospora pubera]|uniref:Protein kinase domain-containing protein n=2 Tax=Rhynchospora pubera TaxID=906938 RepID=A0AAV8CVA1_9POAL|nr:hypothetical protein LUZ62_068696 [Rhynchospora pubera]
MPGQAAGPWPISFFSIFLILTYCGLHAFASDADILLQFRDTLNVSTGGTLELPGWGEGASPCKGIVPLWQGVICNLNGTVLGLQLENMQLTGTLRLDILTGVPSIRSLSFANNNLTGPLPDISILGALKMLYLDHNQFSGQIPAELFANMRSLKKVYLSYNQFSGPIPSSLTIPPTLLEIGLDHNQFEGQIPEFKQDSLWEVDFSYNKLEGSIPAQFSKYNATKFEGNEDLCGTPLVKLCNSSSVPVDSPSLSSESTNKALIAVLVVVSICLVISLIVICIILPKRRQRENHTHEQRQAFIAPLPPAPSRKHDTAYTGATEQPRSSAASSGKRARRDEPGKLSFIREDGQRFELEDLLRASAELLGSGDLWASYKAALFDGPSLVVKKLKEKHGIGREDFQEHMWRLGRLSHPNLLPIVAYIHKKEEKMILTEYVPKGSLAHMLHSQGKNLPPLDWATRLKIVKGVARGLAHLYEELPMLTVAHGHLKTPNVLLTDSFEPLLNDYALLPVMSSSVASKVMVAYKSPECALRGKPSDKSDVWSLGIMILEILTGKFPDYLHHGRSSTDMASWVKLVVREECATDVFDSRMGVTKNGKGEMDKLLKIGLGCCEVNLDKRWDLHHALSRIEELKEEGSEDGHSHSSFSADDEQYFSGTN